MPKIKLVYLGDDDWNRPTFRVGDTETYVKDINLGQDQELSLYWCFPKNDPYGEPGCAFEVDGLEFVGYTPITQEEKFSYMLLSRLQSDCEYYLGYGGRSTNRLWAGDERKQIEKMKELYNSFSEERKPTWITMEKIEEYEKNMCKDEGRAM